VSVNAELVDLLQRFREGDRAAFTQIVGHYQQPLIRFFYRLCWDHDRAEDLTQEVFLRILRGSRKYVARGRLATFLFRVATNLWIDEYRSHQPRPRFLSLEQAWNADEEPAKRDPPATEGGPEQEASHDEESSRLRAALEKLTDRHRLVLELAIYHEMPYLQISQALGIPVGTVKSRMHTTVRFLRNLVAEKNRVATKNGAEKKLAEQKAAEPKRAVHEKRSALA
jgi:RNA polymerase sigma-70 factor (ECF subfamily)